MSFDSDPSGPGARRLLMVSGVPTELIHEQEALDLIEHRLEQSKGLPVAVASINLDHLHHFGRRGVWRGALGHSVTWLNLIDGSPIAAKARRLTGEVWPRLAGSDLIAPILSTASSRGFRVGFLGGMPKTLELLRTAAASQWPDLEIAGTWAPTRSQITDPELSIALAEEVRAAGVDLLVVGLGKPRQELWIETYGMATGAKVMLAFGAVVDFLAGTVSRAPRVISENGLEWAWRLALEPRRLARRYLLQGPPSYLEVQRSSVESGFFEVDELTHSEAGRSSRATHKDGSFVDSRDRAELSVVVVTYNNADHIDPLVASLREQANGIGIRVVVADNNSSDNTVDRVTAQSDISLVKTGGNLGYSGGINAALAVVPRGEHVLVLNPDLTMENGAVRALLARIRTPGVGVVVPAIRDERGHLFKSVRREPSLSRAFGDAVLGDRWSSRPPMWSDTDGNLDSYRYPHPVDWASGAAMLIHADLVDRIGPWDESYFLYMEEVDYQRRVREAGYSVWFEPRAVVRHAQGGSGSSSQLMALMAVNRVRYAEKFGGRARGTAFQALVTLHELVRAKEERHRVALAAVTSRRRWEQLPKAAFSEGRSVEGAVVIPAHNEATVIKRTLDSLGELLSDPLVEVLVISNGSTDETANEARKVQDVRVIEIEEASKVAALNEGDRLATRWPRLYLDADIEVSAAAVRQVFFALSNHGRAGPALEAARPALRYDVDEASWVVRSYVRARQRMTTVDQSLWGAGAYGVSEKGHRRFACFPDVIADDLFVDQVFPSAVKAVLDTEPVVVRMPRTLRSLLSVQRRGVRAHADLGRRSTARRTLLDLLSTVRGPMSFVDSFVYAAVAIAGRVQARTYAAQGKWERDASSR